MRINIHRLYALIFLLPVFCLLSSNHCLGTPPSIPEELKEWVPWVLYKQDEKMCTPVNDKKDEHHCTWPSILFLDVTDQGGTFTQNWLVETESAISLPGNAPFWPQEVKIGHENATITSQNKRPHTWITPGSHTVSGKFVWDSIPDSIHVPPATGIIRLTVNGKAVDNIQIDQQSLLWLKKRHIPETRDEENVAIQVFRKIEDGIPLLQHLHLQLVVSGKPRMFTIDIPGKDNFLPISIQSPLPARFDQDQKLQVQVRPGQWQLNLVLRNNGSWPVEYLNTAGAIPPWPDQEIWVFAADQKLRQVEIKGLTPIDPTRTSLPEEWKSFPAYLINQDSKFHLFEVHRGNPTPGHNRLSVHRKLWLDEGGYGITALDVVTGTMTSGWRLNVSDSMKPGMIEVEGRPTLITRLGDSGRTGVEVRQGQLSLRSVSRIETGVGSTVVSIPAVGWEHSVQRLSAEINLPPGWKIFSASGADRVETWLSSWSLLDIFLVLIISLATGRIIGILWGAAVLLSMALSFQQPGSPVYLWLPLLAALGLRKMLGSSRGGKITTLAAQITLAGLIISSIPFMVNEIRTGIFPQLEYGGYHQISRSEKPKAQQGKLSDSAAPAMEEVRAAKSISSSIPGSYAARSVLSPAPQPLQNFTDHGEMIQTGPGLPDWLWKRIGLDWNGPVKSEQHLILVLISPAINTVLAFVRVLLLSLILAGFLKHCLTSDVKKQKIPASAATAAVFLIIMSAVILRPQNAASEIPGPEILQQLQDRMLAPPECGNHCLSINNCDIKIIDNVLDVTLSLDAQIQTGVNLPGKDRFFEQIILDGDKESAIPAIINNDGFTVLMVKPGNHTVHLLKNVRQSNRISLVFPDTPARGAINAPGWDSNGILADGTLSNQISISRIDKNQSASGPSTETDLPPFALVERTLHMGLKWSITTRIIRKSQGGVIGFELPLLAGEQVTSDGFQVSDHKITINLGPAQQNVVFRSAISTVDRLNLQAGQNSSYREAWYLDVSPIWHVNSTGIPPVNQTNPAGNRFPEYRPYPGETLELAISRPAGIPGPTMTILASKIRSKPGHRATETSLELEINSSRGTQYAITLPAGIELLKTVIDNKELALRHENNRLILPINPGVQQINILWRTEKSSGTKIITDHINLESESVNSTIEMRVPDSRWILFTGGPDTGPAVLFWGELLVMFLVAAALGRLSLTPLKSWQWLLLSIGLSQIPVILGAVVAAWLILMGTRQRQGQNINGIVWFNLMQVALVLLTLVALAILFFAIQQGLLGHPDMQISGNGSSGHLLRWYQDRTGPELPRAWVLSVPIIVYRTIMLLWALWLAVSLLRWLRWGWDCFSSGGSWKLGRSAPKTSTKSNNQRREKNE